MLKTFIFAKIERTISPNVEQSDMIDDPTLLSRLPSEIIMFQPSDEESWDLVANLQLEDGSDLAKNAYKKSVEDARERFNNSLKNATVMEGYRQAMAATETTHEKMMKSGGRRPGWS